MKRNEANDLKPKFNSLINKPTKGGIIESLLVSYIEQSVANEHFRNIAFGMPGIKDVPAYENDFTLWVKLDSGDYKTVREIIINDKVEDLYDSVQLLP